MKIDISPWWPRNEQGHPKSVNAVYLACKAQKINLSRYTLTRAREGGLARADVSKIVALLALASQWAGRKLSLEEICRK